MRRLWIAVMACLLALTACGMSKEEIGETVQRSMQQTFERDPQFKQYRMKVQGVQVLKQRDNLYQGIAKVDFEGDLHEVGVEITVDGKDVMWKAPPGSFMFIAQKEMAKFQAALSDPAAGMKAQVDILNDQCRGGSGDSPQTQQACDARDELYGQLKAAGWCWGREGQSGAEKTWARCSP